MIISDALSVFRQGKALANSATWKNRQTAINCLAGLIASALAVGKALGYELPISNDTIQDLAAGVVAAVGVFNAVATVVTSAKVGLPPVGSAGPDTRGDGPG